MAVCSRKSKGFILNQSKKHSFYESITNILIGYIVAVSSQMLIFPLFEINVPIADNLLIGLYFTVISIVRSYTVRRFYILNGRG
jgi:hypothetical protein